MFFEVKDVMYRFKLKPDAQGTMTTTKSTSVTLQKKEKAQLERMEANQVMEKVTEPTE